jgi:hypothetical protein
MALAGRAATEADRLRLLNMAQAWLELAERAERNAQAGFWHETPPRSGDQSEAH